MSKKLYVIMGIPNSKLENWINKRMNEEITLNDETRPPFKETMILVSKNKLRRRYMGGTINRDNLHEGDGIVNDVFWEEINKQLLLYPNVYIYDSFLTISDRMNIYRKVRGLGTNIELYLIYYNTNAAEALKNIGEIDYNEFDLLRMERSLQPVSNEEARLYNKIYIIKE